jgi:hypothetical protein
MARSHSRILEKQKIMNSHQGGGAGKAIFTRTYIITRG